MSARFSIDQDHLSRGFGYVQFRNADEASKACQKVRKKYSKLLQMDASFVDDQKLEVTLFKSAAERGIMPGSSSLPKRQFNNLFVKNIPKNFTSKQLAVSL